tara:strand:- start:363 stop:713 length:351 start_codon:yes stop_codon:yes gene_type:complete
MERTRKELKLAKSIEFVVSDSITLRKRQTREVDRFEARAEKLYERKSNNNLGKKKKNISKKSDNLQKSNKLPKSSMFLKAKLSNKKNDSSMLCYSQENFDVEVIDGIEIKEYERPN